MYVEEITDLFCFENFSDCFFGMLQICACNYYSTSMNFNLI